MVQTHVIDQTRCEWLVSFSIFHLLFLFLTRLIYTFNIYIYISKHISYFYLLSMVLYRQFLLLVKFLLYTVSITVVCLFFFLRTDVIAYWACSLLNFTTIFGCSGPLILWSHFMRCIQVFPFIVRVIRVSQFNPVLLLTSATVGIHIVSVHSVHDVIFRTDLTVRSRHQVMLSGYLNFCAILLTMN